MDQCMWLVTLVHHFGIYSTVKYTNIAKLNLNYSLMAVTDDQNIVALIKFTGQKESTRRTFLEAQEENL